LKLISKPSSQPIRRALNRVRLCPAEIEEAVEDLGVEPTEVDSHVLISPMTETEVAELAEDEAEIVRQTEDMNTDRGRKDDCPVQELSETLVVEDDPGLSTHQGTVNQARQEAWSGRLHPRKQRKKDHRGR